METDRGKLKPLPANALLRYGRQVVLKAMDEVRNRMRGSRRLALAQAVQDPNIAKAEQNPTLGIDRETEQLMFDALSKKIAKIPEIESYTIFSEETGIRTFPDGAREEDSRLVAFLDPIDGTEFAESLQGGWTLLAFYDRAKDEVLAAIAGDIFLDRLYWAGPEGDAEALDFITHSWFRLDGGPSPAKELSDARVNMLTTKPSRFRAVAEQKRLLETLSQKSGRGRINLAWGSNTIIQVAAGYADVSLEFDKGFATYDILPGLFIGQRAGLAILDMRGNTIETRLDLKEIFAQHRQDPANPSRTKFVAAKDASLAREVLRVLDI